MGGKKESQRGTKKTTGMSSQVISVPINSSQPIDKNMQQPVNTNTTDILGQSRSVLYGQDGTQNGNSNCMQLGHNEQGNIYFSDMTGMSQGAHAQNTCQVNSVQNQHITGIQSTHSIHNSDMNNGMPPWAANMCKQLQNIQLQLETQDKRWHFVEGQLQSQNARMTNIETQITNLSNLGQKVTQNTNNVQSVKAELNNMKTKFDNYEDSVNYYNDICDTIISKNTDIDARIKDLSDKLSSVEDKQERNDEQLLDIQWRSMRENLIFAGIPEPQLAVGERKNCEALIKDFIKEQMRIDREIQIDRVHRLGRYRRDQPFPRPIVVKFTFFKDKEIVRQAAPKTLIGTRYRVNEHFPAEIENRRKLLYPVVKSARQTESNRVKLVRDKLFINGEQYIPDSLNVEAGSRNSSLRTPATSYRRNMSQSIYKPQHIAQRFSRPNTQQNRLAQNHNRRWTPSNNVCAPDNTQTRKENIFTSNRYIVLDTESNENTDQNTATPSYTCTGKKKASSPLDRLNIEKTEGLFCR